MYVIYTVITVLAFLVASPYFLYQAIRYRKYVGSVPQRLGRLPVAFNLDADPSIWIHAVSVGEVLTVRALIPGLRERYPHLRIFLSTTTMTGQQVARSHVRGVDAVFYFPFDLPFIVRRLIGSVRPRLFLMMETEIWPNLLRACRQQGVKAVMVNGRISQRSYPRYRLVKAFIKRVLADVDRFCMQSEESARRIVDLGAPPERVTVTGSLKFDSLDWTASQGRGRERVLRFFKVPDAHPVVIAASTLRGEETAVLHAFRAVRRSRPEALLVIAPRHPERFAEVVELARQEGYRVARRTELVIDAPLTCDVVVLDTIGELARLYQVATVVFVGGSLVDTGGHNILEPAVFGKPILFGPHMHNFAEVASAFLASGAAVEVASARDLEETLVALVGDPVRRAALGAAARALVEANRGACQRTLGEIAAVLPPRGDRAGVVTPFRRAT
ncbi:MAG: waaA [Acidobacteria bacterium]|jgi:3-deoxy-D-manno-octulosonic-acid transferase|nr:waaA [Acidobacteriota bacterium]